MKPLDQLLVFTLDDFRYALHLSAVERVCRAVEITPLPKAPEIVLGVFNIQGRIVPVFNVRRRFRLPEREINPGDQLILAHTSRRSVALLVDSAGAVVECHEQDIVAAGDILPGIEFVEGVVKLEGGMTLIHDLHTFLSLEEEQALDHVMRELGA